MKDHDITIITSPDSTGGDAALSSWNRRNGGRRIARTSICCERLQSVKSIGLEYSRRCFLRCRAVKSHFENGYKDNAETQIFYSTSQHSDSSDFRRYQKASINTGLFVE